MSRRVFLVLLVLLVVGGAGLVSAQPKDPFRPPRGPGSETGEGIADAPAPDAVAPREESDPAQGLPRTGQDVGTPFAAGLGLLAFGLALRLVVCATRPAVRLASRGFGPPRRVVRAPFPYA